MHAVPVLRVNVRLLPLWLVWLLVVVFGRLVCPLAQRIPPVVRLVRHLRNRNGGRCRGRRVVHPLQDGEGYMSRPPLTPHTWPVMYDEASAARKCTTRATSPG